MKRRMTMATATTAMALAILAGCGSDGSAESEGKIAPPPTSPSTSLSEAPSVDPNAPGAVALRGDWKIEAEDYVLHLIEDGTFVEDFQGVTDFRTGKYTVEGDTIALVGDDGNTDEGKIVGETLEFTLGTATRVE
jgi:hypothetical protein